MLSLLDSEQQKQRISECVDNTRNRSIILLNEKGDILTWNIGAQILHGFKPNEVLGKSLAEIFPQGEIAPAMRLKNLLQNAMQQGECEERFYLSCKDASNFWASLFISACYDDEKQFTGFMLMIRKLSLLEQQQAEIEFK